MIHGSDPSCTASMILHWECQAFVVVVRSVWLNGIGVLQFMHGVIKVTGIDAFTTRAHNEVMWPIIVLCPARVCQVDATALIVSDESESFHLQRELLLIHGSPILLRAENSEFVRQLLQSRSGWRASLLSHLFKDAVDLKVACAMPRRLPRPVERRRQYQIGCC